MLLVISSFFVAIVDDGGGGGEGLVNVIEAVGGDCHEGIATAAAAVVDFGCEVGGEVVAAQSPSEDLARHQLRPHHLQIFNQKKCTN